MEPLPKIAREQLRRAPVSDHPDADLLTAFAEQSLTGRERAQVADHLSQCVDCRKVLVLALPAVNAELPATSQSKTFPHRRVGLLSWPVLRWGAVAACVVVASAAGLLLSRRTSQQIPEKMASATQLEKPQVAMEERQTSGPPAAAAQNSAVDVRRQTLDSYAKENAPAPSKIPATAENRKRFVRLPDERASKDTAALLALTPGVAGKTEADKLSQVTPAAAAPSRADVGQVSIAQAVPSAPPQLEKESVADQKASTESSHTKEGQVNRPQVYSETVEVTAETPVLQTQTATMARKAAPKAKAERDEAKSDAGFAGAKVSNELAATAATTSGGLLMHDVSSAQWTLSPDGLPQRSFDSGKTWEKMQVDHHSGFRALSAQGMNVWVGGLAGILYHSSDVGMHWKRIIPVSEDTTLASDIVSLDFHDPLHGKVTTGNHESWITSDGGKTWQKQ